MLKVIYRILLYFSIAFFAYYLYQADYLLIGKVDWNYYYLGASIIVVCYAFILQCFSWRNALKVHDVTISKRAAVQSHGKSILAKYIPGKVWVIIGRSTIIAQQGYSLQLMSAVSLKEQLIYILAGLMIGLVPFLVYFGFTYVALFIFLSILGLIFILFSKKVHDLTIQLLSRILKKEVNIPLLTFSKALPIGGYVFIVWAFSAIGFFLFVRSILPDAQFTLALAFPLSISYGILAIVVPGGIGVREGILTAYFTAVGVDTAQAVTVSILSRLWYVVGELFLFILSLIIGYRTSK